MSEIAAIIFSIFCTPVGWVGMLCFGYMVKMIRNKESE
jgi:hypothetical protein